MTDPTKKECQKTLLHCEEGRAEYAAKWEYVRHLEKSRAGTMQWYAVVVGAILAFALKDLDGKTITEWPAERPYLIPLLVFALVYSAITLMYLHAHKRNYERYTARLTELEGSARVPKARLGVFDTYFLMASLLGVGLAFLLAWLVGGARSYGLGWGIGYFVFCVVFFAYEWRQERDRLTAHSRRGG